MRTHRETKVPRNGTIVPFVAARTSVRDTTEQHEGGAAQPFRSVLPLPLAHIHEAMGERPEPWFHDDDSECVEEALPSAHTIIAWGFGLIAAVTLAALVLVR